MNLNKSFAIHIPSSATPTAFWFSIPNSCSVVVTLFSQMPYRQSLTHSTAKLDRRFVGEVGGVPGGVLGRPYIRLCIAFNLACLVWVTFETHNWKRIPQSQQTSHDDNTFLLVLSVPMGNRDNCRGEDGGGSRSPLKFQSHTHKGPPNMLLQCET